MKINNLTFYITILLTHVICTQLSAAELLTDDATVKHHERKVLFQLTDIGIQKRTISLPVTYCPLNAKKNKKIKCKPKGHWKYTINQSLEDTASKALLKELNGKRYDSLKIMKGKLAIKTIFENIEIDSNVKNFSYDYGNESDFKNKVKSYLNNNISPLMLRLLEKTNDARYKEMSDKEQETFLSTIAKEESVPLHFIKKLMNSAYVFAFHANKIKGSVSINQEERENKKKKKYLVYDTSISVKSEISLIIFHFDSEKNQFKHYSTVKGQKHSGGSSQDFRKYPTKEKTTRDFNKAFGKIAKPSGSNINYKLKKDENFVIFATVDQLKDYDIKSRIGEIEDLRIDAPYNIFQYQDGKRKEVGWIKARSVASEKSYKKDYANYYSDFDLINGSVEIKDQIKEHPWLGGFLYIGAVTNTISINEIDGKSESGGGTYTGLNLGIKLDMGYVLNKKSFSERWLELNLNFGIGGDDITLNNNVYSDTTAITLGLDIVQRKNLKSYGWYWGYKYGIGIASLSGKDSSENELSVSAPTINLGLQFGFLPSPKREYFTNLDLMIPFAGSAKLGSGDNSNKLDASLSPIIGMTIGISI